MHHIQLEGQQIPVGKIVCIGRNYAAHARELGNPVPDDPVLFIKPASSLLFDGGDIVIPPYSRECHYEVELAVLIGTTGKGISEQDAMLHVGGYAVAIDLTLRDVQTVQKTKGLPWEIAKAFDTSCPISDFVAPDTVSNPQGLNLLLSVNGELRQDGTTADMLRPVNNLIAAASHYFTLERGDILLTGTPEGVGPVQSGDRIKAMIDGVVALEVTVA